MVRVPKLPLSMTASANSAPSMGAVVDPVTGYPSLACHWHATTAARSGVPVFDRGSRARPHRGRRPESHYRGPVFRPVRDASLRGVDYSIVPRPPRGDRGRAVIPDGAATRTRGPLRTGLSAK